MSMNELTLGLILLKEGKLTKDQLKRSLLKQGEIRRFGRHQKLGEVIAKLGFLAEDEVNAALEMQSTLLVQGATHTVLGLMLIEAGLLTPSQVFDALVEQTMTEKRLGDILKDKGFLTEEQLAPFLARQLTERAEAEARLQEELKTSGLSGGDDDFIIFDMGGDDTAEELPAETASS